MVVAISTREKLIWTVTSQQIREYFSVFQIYMRGGLHLRNFNFNGPNGSEPACRCPGCRRMIPIETATIDHYIARSSLHYEVCKVQGWDGGLDSFARLGELYKIKSKGTISLIPFDMDARPQRLHYEVLADNETLHCTKPGDCFEIDLNIMAVLENALENLQPMCAYCNSKKGNR